MIDLEYYKLVVKTQNEPYVLKQELKDLIYEVEAEKGPDPSKRLQKLFKEIDEIIDKNPNLVTELDEETWNLGQRLVKGI